MGNVTIIQDYVIVPLDSLEIVVNVKGVQWIVLAMAPVLMAVASVSLVMNIETVIPRYVNVTVLSMVHV